MTIDVHISDTHTENINVQVNVNNGKSLSMWQKLRKNYPKQTTALCYSGVLALLGLVCYGLGKITKTPPVGNDNSRSHVRKDGVPKVGYESKERANLQAMWDNIKYDTDMNSYLCPQCGKYHVGHDYTAKTA